LFTNVPQPIHRLSDFDTLPPAAHAAIARMNARGQARTPFLIVADYKQQRPLVLTPAEAASAHVFYHIGSHTNVANSSDNQTIKQDSFRFSRFPMPFADYEPRFRRVQEHLRRGNSFLTNLTRPTPVDTNLSLADIFSRSHAPYRLLVRDEFVVFSPETFIKIENNVIRSHPMKGTIPASEPNARQRILADPKEAAEHATIVDLIRNDISQIARQVWVERYRYLETVPTHTGDLLQLSSEIRGTLPPNWADTIGTLLFQLLPAGSITGAPKPQTRTIIDEVEGYERGYYTGIAGFFDGTNFDCGVLIRFIEQTPNGLIFKSGGGITVYADAESEYKELIDKVYLPFG
jgi:para-aminobenzoate synthetase component I